MESHPYGIQIIEAMVAGQDYVVMSTNKRAVLEHLKSHFSLVSVQVKRKGFLIFKRKIYVVKCYYL